MLDLKNTVSRIMCIMMTASCLTGCGIPIPGIDTAETENESDTLTTLGLKPDLDYERPTVESHIEVDQLGYLPNQDKIAIFMGEDLGEEFSVVSADDLNEVYVGSIRMKKATEQNDAYYYGDFSEVTTPGEYYIRTDVIGYSYKFRIEENIYDDLKADVLKQFYYNRCGYSLTRDYAGDNVRNACHTEMVSLRSDASAILDVSGGWHVDTSGDRDVKCGCNAVEAMLMAYEYNTSSFDDNGGIPESGDGIPDILNEIKVETDWLLKMQEQSSGAVYEGVSVVDTGQGSENPCHVEDTDLSTTLCFASAMAYFSYLYQNFDAAYATTCIQAADRAMKYAANYADSANRDEYFRAAAMMYRATGYANYRNIVTDYLGSNASPDMQNNVVFSGSVTYLATRQKTDKNYCAVLMKCLRNYAEDLSEERGDVLFVNGGESEKTANAALLNEIARLTVVNYIICSNEYEELMQKYLHYFLGCNPENICYAGNYGSKNASDTGESFDITKQPETDAYLLLLLSGINDNAEQAEASS